MTDFSPYLTKVQSAKPSLLLVLNQGDQFVNCLKQAASFGIQKTIPLGGPQVELEAVEALPLEARVGFWGVEWYYNSPLCVGPAGSPGRQFVAEYKKRYGKTPSARSAFGYIAMDRMLLGDDQAKSTDAAKTCKALRERTLPVDLRGHGVLPQGRSPTDVADVDRRDSGQRDACATRTTSSTSSARQEPDKIEQTRRRKGESLHDHVPVLAE